MATPGQAQAVHPSVEADPRCTWVTWTLDSTDEIAHKVEQFAPLDTVAGHKAARWLRERARGDHFTVTELLVSDERLEGFITCRVSEATLTWSGVESLGVSREEGRKRVPAYLLCWCAKHNESLIDGDELVLNALRMAREVSRYGCAVLALDPHDDECAEKVWRRKHGFRDGAVPAPEDVPGPENAGHRRLWTPLSVD
jgi:hypothetical protein